MKAPAASMREIWVSSCLQATASSGCRSCGCMNSHEKFRRTTFIRFWRRKYSQAPAGGAWLPGSWVNPLKLTPRKNGRTGRAGGASGAEAELPEIVASDNPRDSRPRRLIWRESKSCGVWSTWIHPGPQCASFRQQNGVLAIEVICTFSSRYVCQRASKLHTTGANFRTRRDVGVFSGSALALRRVSLRRWRALCISTRHPA